MRTHLILLTAALGLPACSGKTSDTSTSGTTDTSTEADTDDSGDTDEDESVEPEYPTGTATGCDLTNHSYLLDFTSARVLEPAALGPILADAIGDSLAMGISAQTDSNVSVLLALTDDGNQDMCTPSVHPPDGTWVDPVMAVGPADLSVEVDGSPVTLSSFQFTAASNAECTGIESGVFQSDLDARLLGPALGSLVGTEDPQGICDALLAFGATCGACDSDGEAFCIKLIIDRMSAPDRGIPLEEVTTEDIAANSECG